MKARKITRASIQLEEFGNGYDVHLKRENRVIGIILVHQMPPGVRGGVFPYLSEWNGPRKYVGPDGTEKNGVVGFAPALARLLQAANERAEAPST